MSGQNEPIPQGQLSFLLKAGSDTLPTAMNLSRMKYNVIVGVNYIKIQDHKLAYIKY